MSVPQIAQLPDPPVRSDAPVDFSLKADVFLGALPGFGQQTNMVATYINGRALSATESATIAYNHSQAAASSASEASASAQQAGGSAAASANSAGAAQSAASSASGSASAAAQSASSALASANLAQDAADYVEGMTDGAAPLNSPLFTGNPRAPTPAQGDDSQSLATTAFVQAKVGTLGTAATRNMGTGAADLRQNSQNDAQFVAKSQIKGVTGQSNADVMSQKATTDAIAAAVAEALENIDVSGPRPIKNHGDVATAGAQTVICNVQESDFHIMSMETANATGTLTIDFANMPDTTGKYFSWHVRLQRGSRKSVVFAQEIEWTGGTQPPFGGSSNSIDLLMFYRVGNEPIRGMAVDAR